MRHHKNLPSNDINGKVSVRKISADENFVN